MAFNRKKLVLIDIISINFEHANFNYAFYLSLAKNADVSLFLSASSADYLRKSGLNLDSNVYEIKIVDHLPFFFRIIFSYLFCLWLVFSSEKKLIISGYEFKSFVILNLFFPVLILKPNRIDIISHNHFEKFLDFKFKFFVFFVFRFAGIRFIALNTRVRNAMLSYFNSENVEILLHPVIDKISSVDLKNKVRDVIDFFCIGRHTRNEELWKILNLFNKIKDISKRLNLPISTKKYLESHNEIDVKSINFFQSEDRDQYLRVLESMDVLILPNDRSLQYRASGVALDSVFFGNLILCEQPFYMELFDLFTDGENFDFTKIDSIQTDYEVKMKYSFEQYCLK